MSNETLTAVNMMGPGEIASPSNLVQPGGGRIKTVRFLTGEQVTFRATTDQGFVALCTRIFGVAGDGQVTLVLDKDGNKVLECTGPLFEGG